MNRRELSRNTPCPCGSGKKYKLCCWGQGFDWLDDEPGAAARDPGDDDLLFPGAAAEPFEHHVVEAMKRTGIDPALIYAFEETGYLVSEDNQHLIPEHGLQAWYAAVARYNARHNRS
jgi:hypothetical protein